MLTECLDEAGLLLAHEVQLKLVPALLDLLRKPRDVAGRGVRDAHRLLDLIGRDVLADDVERLHRLEVPAHVPRYGNYGALTDRWVKGTKGSGPRRRTVLTSPEFSWAVELSEYWCSEGRELFTTADRSPAVWPSERGGRLTLNALGRSFTTFRQRAGLPPELEPARAMTLLTPPDRRLSSFAVAARSVSRPSRS